MKFVFNMTGLIGLALLFSVNAFANTYVVKKGDTIASIARSYYGEPVFGPKGTINKIYRLNPWAKSKPSLEVGQTVMLEDKKTEPAPTAPVVSAPLPAPPESTSSPEKIVPAPVVPPTDVAPVPAISATTEKPPVAEQPTCPEKTCAAAAKEEEEEEKPRSFFSVIPSYAQIQQTAKDVASGTSYTLHSGQAFGVELGWDRWWSSSFSTLLTYSFLQLSSSETSDASGSKVIDNMTLSMAELALLNRFATHWRAGLGVAYGDHIFLEDFVAAPVDPKIYRIAFFNPFAMLEWTAYESRSFEGAMNLKAASLPAQVGHGHDLTSGYEFVAQLSLLQKFGSWSLLYGASYATENQTRVDADETANRWDLKLGALF